MAMRILKNAIITPDGTELRSYHRHDYKSHQDKTNGVVYSVDGGTDYLRRTGGQLDYTDTSVFDNGNHELVREHFCWGTYGKDGNLPEHVWVPLKNIGDNHLQNILVHLDLLQVKNHYAKGELYSLKYVEDEIEYRKKNNIVIEETTYV